MKYKPMEHPRSRGGPATLHSVLVIGGHPHAVWLVRDFDERNNRADGIHLLEFEPEEVEVSEFDRADGKPPRSIKVKL